MPTEAARTRPLFHPLWWLTLILGALLGAGGVGIGLYITHSGQGPPGSAIATASAQDNIAHVTGGSESTADSVGNGPHTTTSEVTTTTSPSLSSGTGATGESPRASPVATTKSATVSADANTVDWDIYVLSVDVSSLQSDLGIFPPTLQQAQDDLATVAADEQIVDSEATNGTDASAVCADANTVATDADAVGTDGTTTSFDATNIEADVENTDSDIAGLQSDYAAYNAALGPQPSDAPGTPTAAAVYQASTAATEAVGPAVSTANGDINLVNTYEGQADAEADAAAQAGHCPAPTPNMMQAPLPTS
ncbi:MAG TPA: hypothetical protein VHY81_00610 [Acidimicrobiales bacterium]|nr:hypothetical protein [Acidimicrobiales bacterium]